MQRFCIPGAALLLLSYFTLGEIGYADDEEAPVSDRSSFSRSIEQADVEAPPARKASRVSTRLSDDEVVEDEGSGFRWPALPKPKLPSLPKPKLPKLSLPTWTTARELPRERMRPTDEPSTWEKFSTGTKDLFSKTKQTLMPWNQEDTVSSSRKPGQPPRRTPPKSAARVKAKTASAEKKPLFPWFSKAEEENPPETVNDFLSQPRIR